MEVIFIKDLKGQGKKGEIKKVADGYGKNFLIQKGYAVLKNTTNMQNLRKEQKEEQLKDEENRKLAEELKKKLEKEQYKFKVRTGAHDKVFGSVSTKQIKEKLDEKYKITKNQIVLENPITSLGYHNITINLYKDIKANLKIELIK